MAFFRRMSAWDVVSRCRGNAHWWRPVQWFISSRHPPQITEVFEQK
ncbi:MULTISPECIES: hypothetical protein [unclassified Pseudomonas]